MTDGLAAMQGWDNSITFPLAFRSPFNIARFSLLVYKSNDPHDPDNKRFILGDLVDPSAILDIAIAVVMERGYVHVL